MKKDNKAKAKKPVKKANPLLDEEKDETETDVEETTEEENKDTEAENDEADEAEDEEAEEDTAEEVDEKIKPKQDKVAPRSANSVEAEMLTDIEKTKRALAKQSKVRIFIPLGIGEKKGSKSAVETVTINGYRTVLPKGEYVTVPEAIADQIEKHYNMSPENSEIGQQFRLDRPRFKDGMSTDEALS